MNKRRQSRDFSLPRYCSETCYGRHPIRGLRDDGSDDRSYARPRAVLTVLIFLLFAICNVADARSVAVEFPREGHCRAGCYWPARVTVGADASATSITLTADGAVSTELPLLGGKTDTVIPWLAARGAVSGGKWSIAAGQKVIAEGPVEADLEPLADDERLVVYTDGDVRDAVLAAASIMPGRRVVPLRLDLSEPLLAPPAAYESIDLLLLGASAVTRVRESTVAVLAAGGTAVGVRADQKPTGDWPWRQIQVPGGPTGHTRWWVLDHPPVGPRSLLDMEAYAPTYGWEHGWPADVRRRAVVLAAITAIALLGLSLWRSRHAAWAAAGLSLTAAAAIVLWTNRQSPLLSAGGALVEWDGAISQRDYWAYRSTLRNTDISIPWGIGRAAGATASILPTMLTKPVFFNALQMRQTGVKLICGLDGRPDHFTAHLATDATLGFLGRSLEPRKPVFHPVDRVTPVTPDTAGLGDDDANLTLTSPLYVLADQLYPGRVSGRVVDDEPRPPGADGPRGQGGRPDGQWQTIFIDNEPLGQ
jgi:hypothetical protein